MPFPLIPGGGVLTEWELDVELFLELELADPIAWSTDTVGAPEPELDRRWLVRKVNRAGGDVVDLPNANPDTITKTLRSEDEFAFSIPKTDPLTAELHKLDEVQLWRLGPAPKIRTWGPILGRSASSSDGAKGFTGRGVWWYFRKTFFGTAQRSNMIRNGDFELGPADGTLGTAIPGWRKVGDVQARHFTSATKPGGHGLPDPLRGTKAVALASDEEGANSYLRARFPFRTDFPPGQRLTFAAWVYIGDGWIGPAAFAFGLYAERVVAGEVENRAFASIDDDTPRGEWTRLECSLIARPHRDGVVEVRLYSPAGWVVWDESLSVLMESTGAGFRGADQTALAATIVRYGQTGRGKSSKNIATECPPSGVHRVRAWQHADHEWLADSIEELAAMADGFDYDVALTASTRTFRTFYPRKGTDRSLELELRLGRPEDGGTCASYQWSGDSASVATDVISRGAGDGPDREEGGARDTSEVDGLVLNAYEDAPANLPIGELDEAAEAVLDSVKDEVEVLSVVLHRGAMVGDEEALDVLDTGDLVSSAIDDGPGVQIDGVWRIVSLVIDCRADTMALTLNREPE